MTNKNGSPYRDDALYISEDTTVDEIVDYMIACMENPVRVGDSIVWNYSTHEIDHQSIDEVKSKEQDRFIIPYQVTSIWAFMFQLLPEPMKNAESLVYDSDVQKYYAYRGLYRTTVNERQDQIRNELARRLESELGSEVGIHE
jgi:hypothetical protein